MKTKAQKQTELEKAKKLFAKSRTLILTDFGRIKVNDLKKLRTALREQGADYMVMKKRLLGLLLKEKGIEFDSKAHKLSIGAIYSDKHIEEIAAPVVKFFGNLGEEIKAVEKVLGGYHVEGKAFIEPKHVIMIGNLPPREVLLAQLLGMLQAPVSSLLYLFQERSKKLAI
ncbi:MAG: 50S ribosomal protein L10 [Parcubacteria group bacterium Gr01-1014_20]|nr:MAG: 50S ribosomal protein L10 [Parcubacteria group bacterium Gr01-1014_20]